MSACHICHDTGRYHPLGGQELTRCPACAPVVTAPVMSPLNAAWAEAERLTDIASLKDVAAMQADDDRRHAHDEAGKAWAIAEAIGPRPAKVPT